MGKFYVEDTEWAQQLEQGYQEYMSRLWEELDSEPLEGDPLPTLSGEPFCGCGTCETREQLFFLTPKIIEGYKTGKVTLEEDNG